jgi:hypothetical protein
MQAVEKEKHMFNHHGGIAIYKIVYGTGYVRD